MNNKIGETIAKMFGAISYNKPNPEYMGPDYESYLNFYTSSMLPKQQNPDTVEKVMNLYLNKIISIDNGGTLRDPPIGLKSEYYNTFWLINDEIIPSSLIVRNIIEKAEAAFDEKNAKELEKKMREQTFTLEDFLVQMRSLKKMGNLDQLLAMVPGANTGALKNAQIDENQMAKTEAIILSMTKQERMKPDIINGSRRKRIANGSGTSVEDVNKLLKQFDQMKKMMKQFTNMGKRRMMGGMKLPF